MGNVFAKKDIDPRFLRPNGLYPLDQFKWDLKTMKKFVLDRKVAPFFPGADEITSPLEEECPICMLYYPGGLNRARCCKKPVCTECYFSIRPPGATSPVDCPFCQQPNFITSFTGPLSDEERKKQEEEVAKVKELENKMRLEEIERDRVREEERKKKKGRNGTTKEVGGRKKKSEEKQRKIDEEKKKVEEEEKRKMEGENREEKANNPDQANLGDDPLNNLDTSNMTADEIEDLMLNEAIRLSLMNDTIELQEQIAPGNRLLNSGSSDTDDDKE